MSVQNILPSRLIYKSWQNNIIIIIIIIIIIRHGHENERLTIRDIHKLKLLWKRFQRRLYYFELRVRTGVDPVISGLVVCTIYQMLLEWSTQSKWNFLVLWKKNIYVACCIVDGSVSLQKLLCVNILTNVIQGYRKSWTGFETAIT